MLEEQTYVSPDGIEVTARHEAQVSALVANGFTSKVEEPAVEAEEDQPKTKPQSKKQSKVKKIVKSLKRKNKVTKKEGK